VVGAEDDGGDGVKKELFSARVIADSVNPDGNRLTTMELKYPRFIHSELMTHRDFSRNAASSRAIPIAKMIKAVRENPAGPIRWGSNGKGMQDHGVLDDHRTAMAQADWFTASRVAAEYATTLENIGCHKQIANRVLEPFAWMTVLVSATEWENFFALRVHRAAQPEFQWLAYLALKAYVASDPKQLYWGDWHLPYMDRMPAGLTVEQIRKVSAARCARVSYLNHEGEISVEKDYAMHDDLATDGHWSPFEHPAVAEPGRSGNFIGWKSYRKHFPGERRRCDLKALLERYEQENGL
jgi:hypothetical protein